VKACQRRPASAARSRMARHWRSLIRHGIHTVIYRARLNIDGVG